MAYVDLTEADQAPASPGIYPVYVKKCIEKDSSGGDPMFVLTLTHQKTGAPICRHNVMLAGKGKGLGVAALKALGYDDGLKGNVYPEDVEQRRAWVAIKHVVYKDKDQAGVDISRGKCGWWHWDSQHDDIIKAREWEEKDAPF